MTVRSVRHRYWWQNISTIKFRSVSYTHLDVYKRQEWKPTFPAFAKARKRIETLFSQLCDPFMIIRNYAKDTELCIRDSYRTLKKPEASLEYYLRIEQMKPDNLSIEMNIGHCYFEQENYDEALKYYFKVDYLSLIHI